MGRDRLESNRDRRSAHRTCTEPSFPFDTALEAVLGGDVPALLADPRLGELERDLDARRRGKGDESPFPRSYDASMRFARACWLACRVTGAMTVVETGVAAGFSTSFILHALDLNGGGALHSIDVPPYDVVPRDVGWLIPPRLRTGWTLHRARSRRALAPLLRELGELDVFVHDGLHTFSTMRFELRTGGLAVRRAGVVLCDDAHLNRAFLDWTSRSGNDSALVRSSGSSRFGIARIRVP